MNDRKAPPPHDATMPSRSQIERPSASLRTTEALDLPWMVRQFLDGDGDLHSELAQRYPNQPLLSLIHVRSLPTSTPRSLATLSTQDGAASLAVEIDEVTRGAQFSFSLASMLTLRFHLMHLSDLDRGQWMELVDVQFARPAILWGKLRWRSDYLIWSRRQHFTNIYAFSPQQTEAAARLTHDVTEALLGWLRSLWAVSQDEDRAAPSAW
jgi:hypothetical protein